MKHASLLGLLVSLAALTSSCQVGAGALFTTPETGTPAVNPSIPQVDRGASATPSPAPSLAPGCEPSKDLASRSEPIVAPRGQPPFALIMSAGKGSTIDAARDNGFDAKQPSLIPATVELQKVLVGESASGAVQQVILIYADSPIAESTRLDELIGQGGLLIHEMRAAGQDAAAVKDEIGDRASILDIGPFEAALVYPQNLPAYNLYWSDGERDWIMISGLMSPDQTVDVARSIYCQ